MLWECSECEAHTEADSRPRYCEQCGLAGIIFVEAEQMSEGDDNADTMTASWLDHGLRWEEAVASFQVNE